MMGAVFALNAAPSLCCVVGAALAALLYLAGAVRLWRRSHGGRRHLLAQAGWFVAGWSVGVLPAVTSLHVLGRQVFALHMSEHELLMTVAAPLLVVSRPWPTMLWALPRPERLAVGTFGRASAVQSVWRALTDLRVATLLQAIVLWGWHWPPAFRSALLDESLHTLQHLCFLGTSLLFWHAIFVGGADVGSKVMALFATTMHTSLLGAWVTFSRDFWYSEPYLGAFCGLTRAEDQQLAGLIMWIPGSVFYLAAATFLLINALSGRAQPLSAATYK